MDAQILSQMGDLSTYIDINLNAQPILKLIQVNAVQLRQLTSEFTSNLQNQFFYV